MIEAQNLCADLMHQCLIGRHATRSESIDDVVASYLEMLTPDNRSSITSGLCQFVVSRMEAVLSPIEDAAVTLVEETDTALAACYSKMLALDKELKATKEEFSKLQSREVHRLNDPYVRSEVWRLTGGKCAYCDVPIQDGAGLEPTSMCVEHVVPKSMGGPDHLTNYVPACRSCNNSKSDRHVLTLVRKLQRRTDVIVEAAE
jgi:hypothetical protein